MKEKEPSQKKEETAGPLEVAAKATLAKSKAARKVMNSLQKIIRGL